VNRAIVQPRRQNCNAENNYSGGVRYGERERPESRQAAVLSKLRSLTLPVPHLSHVSPLLSTGRSITSGSGSGKSNHRIAPEIALARFHPAILIGEVVILITPRLAGAITPVAHLPVKTGSFFGCLTN
jgi:hypothetical protein